MLSNDALSIVFDCRSMDAVKVVLIFHWTPRVRLMNPSIWLQASRGVKEGGDGWRTLLLVSVCVCIWNECCLFLFWDAADGGEDVWGRLWWFNMRRQGVGGRVVKKRVASLSLHGLCVRITSWSHRVCGSRMCVHIEQWSRAKWSSFPPEDCRSSLAGQPLGVSTRVLPGKLKRAPLGGQPMSKARVRKENSKKKTKFVFPFAMFPDAAASADAWQVSISLIGSDDR